ncbi:glycosyltransferase family 2 protein [Gloeobacter morelensis]|uniref:Glycosyltransferase n=1 Tax=Gloeobacter morelensis MG652769 TaxID=2781736 RepID=A0ABY3PQK4_9CYAN|nr:glycosyltransferase family 2 protein [Gloeobacter morelensis]UFP95972.1 glycosyltransferase [Gloeobacter morelensis MG652769]
MGVTVVTPAYNAVQFLPQLLANLAGLKGVDLEHIVVDGGSNDGTLDLLSRWADRYNLRWISEKDKGQYDAINKGFALATRPLVGYQNVDDFYFPAGLVELARYLEEHPDVTGAYGQYAIVDGAGRFLAYPHNVGDFSPKKLCRGNYIFPGAFIVRRAQLQAIVFDARLNFYGDWDWLLQMALSGRKLAYVPTLVAAFRRHQASKTSTWSAERLQDEWRYICTKHSLDLRAVKFDAFATRLTQRLVTEAKKRTGLHDRDRQAYQHQRNNCAVDFESPGV